MGVKLLDACVLDVAATGDLGFAAGDAKLQRAVANAPGWSKLSNGSAPSLLAPTLGEASGDVTRPMRQQHDAGHDQCGADAPDQVALFRRKHAGGGSQGTDMHGMPRRK